MLRQTKLCVEVTDVYTFALYEWYRELREALHRLEQFRRGADENALYDLKSQVEITIEKILETDPDSGLYANNEGESA